MWGRPVTQRHVFTTLLPLATRSLARHRANLFNSSVKSLLPNNCKPYSVVSGPHRLRTIAAPHGKSGPLFAIAPHPGCARFGTKSDTPHIHVPQYELDIKAVRASGPGGQNVNKVSTCVEVRFNVDEAWWLEPDVKERFKEQQGNRINKRGEYMVSSQIGRTQEGNRKDAIKKLQQAVNTAAVVPKERDMFLGITEKGKQERRVTKKARKATKTMRKVGKNDW